MARDHARLYCAIWGNADFVALPAGPQRLYMLALSQPGLSYAGVVPYTPNRWARLAANTSPAQVRRDVRLLVEARFVVVDESTEEMLIRTYVHHDGVLRSPNVTIAMTKAAHQIVSPVVRKAFMRELVRLSRVDAGHAAWNAEPVRALLEEARSDAS